MKTVLVTGFGAFPGVERNPTERLALEVDGAVTERVRVVGRVLDVAWERGPQQAVAAAREIGADLVIGLGVAVSRDRVEVERIAHCGHDGRPDVDGRCLAELVGPEVVAATVDCGALAEALGAGLSSDAGRYVCNAWLYTVCQALEVPVGFVHVPAAGLDAQRLLRALDAIA